jgi:phosphatidylglycerol---prolipoprotein diacylglyceryl transferase
MLAQNCLVWDANPVIGDFGFITIRWYGLFLSLSFFSGYLLFYWQMKRAGRVGNLSDLFRFLHLVIYLIIGIIFGAYLGSRIFYQWESFSKNPLATMGWGPGLSGLSSHGAFLGLLLAVFLFHLRYRYGFVDILDRLSFGGAVGVIGVRLGNLMNSECVGTLTSLPWAFCFPRYDAVMLPRHPAQLYEAALGMAALMTLFIVDHKFEGEKRPLGLLTGVLFLSYFTLRFIIEFFKEGEGLSFFPPLTLPQLLCLPLALVGLIMIIRSLQRSHSGPLRVGSLISEYFDTKYN